MFYFLGINLNDEVACDATFCIEEHLQLQEMVPSIPTGVFLNTSAKSIIKFQTMSSVITIDNMI